MSSYAPQSWYYNRTRLMLQDMVMPYRYTDDTLAFCLNSCIREIQRIRPDIFLDIKYMAPLRKGDTFNGADGVGFSTDPATGLAPAPNSTADTPVPIPDSYSQTLIWGATGFAQFLDVTDTQDTRAQGFLAKLQAHLTTLSAA